MGKGARGGPLVLAARFGAWVPQGLAMTTLVRLCLATRGRLAYPLGFLATILTPILGR